MKNFFRKVAFGIGPKEEVPSDPVHSGTAAGPCRGRSLVRKCQSGGHRSQIAGGRHRHGVDWWQH